MKKAIIARDINTLLEQDDTFLDRKDVHVLPAETADEVLALHRAEKADLIITRLDLPGMPAERLFHAIREDPALRAVSTVLCCANTPEAIAESSRSRVNAVLLAPLHPVLLAVKAQQLLNIAARESFRVLLGITVDGRAGIEAFYCRSKNISSSGILIETRRRLAEGARLSCQFSLPEGPKITAAGKIVRIIQYAPGADGHQYGLMFTDIDPAMQQVLADYVERKRAERRRT